MPQYHWFFDAAHPGQSTKWQEFTQRQAAELEAALQAGQGTHRVDDEHYVELAELVQRRVDDPSHVRAVRRSLTNPDQGVSADQGTLHAFDAAKTAAAKAAKAEHEVHEAAIAAARAEAELAKLSEKAQELEEAAADSALHVAILARKAGDDLTAHRAEVLMEEALERSDADAQEAEAALQREHEAEQEAASLQLQETAAADAARDEAIIEAQFGEPFQPESRGSSGDNSPSPATPPPSLASSSTDLLRGMHSELPDLAQLHAQLAKLNQPEQEEFVSIDLGSGGAAAPIQDFERLVTESGDSRRRYLSPSFFVTVTGLGLRAFSLCTLMCDQDSPPQFVHSLVTKRLARPRPTLRSCPRRCPNELPRLCQYPHLPPTLTGPLKRLLLPALLNCRPANRSMHQRASLTQTAFRRAWARSHLSNS